MELGAINDVSPSWHPCEVSAHQVRKVSAQ